MKAAVLLSWLLVLALHHPAVAADKIKILNAKQMAALLSSGKTIKVTGAGDHYSGKLVLTADGKGSGEVTLADGKTVALTGTWQLKRFQFCHKWQDIEPAEVCENWVPIGPNKALILVKRIEVGVVTWD